ncbi:homoserine kinase [Bacillus lacus]|uniref:Homoserine kinase n=1 Tax=Metabacillus lacus TaxID=1983721 RepID=A0A7X2LY43_9BACI|nr:homoserine kinase [Metabacillus lacus]MRX73220.1 homoserine kinase [Metabacillus lacus]
MRDCDSVKITVPGSTANLGPGFDSIGLAVNRYLVLTVKRFPTWNFTASSKEVEGLPCGEENLICKAALLAAGYKNRELPPCAVEVWSDIPVARGLGSSAAAIVGGIELANQVCGLQLTNEEKLFLGCSMEKHPDNVGASIYGGMIIGCWMEETAHAVSMPAPDAEFAAYIPSYELFTKDARSVLPSSFGYPEAVSASAVSNVMIAALISGNLKVAGSMMKSDMFHQPYRRVLIPEMEEVEKTAEEHGALATVISGAGPALILLCEKGTGSRLISALKERFSEGDVVELKADPLGVRVTWDVPLEQNA